jgi:ABC-type transport system involved in cytochrome bd biosynthesis fused ATPase/permease subunit
VYGTVRENLTLGNKWVPDPVLEELIEKVRLGQWFKSLPNGLDTVIGKDIEPSGGEQSRISLLRLFVHLRNYGPTGSHPITDEVIILDEVTSALDKRDVFIKDNELSTEEAVIKVIDEETKGSTMFVISHEDVSSNAFGFKDIVDEQMVIDIDEEGGRTLRKM